MENKKTSLLEFKKMAVEILELENEANKLEHKAKVIKNKIRKAFSEEINQERDCIFFNWNESVYKLSIDFDTEPSLVVIAYLGELEDFKLN